MRLLVLLFLTFISLISAARKHGSGSCAKRACVNTLQRVIYSPIEANDVFSEDDILDYEAELRTYTPLLFTSQNASIYWTLENKYKMRIEVFDGFNHGWIYRLLPTPSIEYVEMSPQSANYARSLTNYGAYVYHSSLGRALYTFNVFNTDGRMIVVTFIMNDDNIIPGK